MKNYKLPLLIASMIIVAILIVGLKDAEANPSQIMLSASAPATTTKAYMTPGTATTSPVFDSQSDGSFPTDSAVLLTWMDATNTTSAIDIYPQYSDGVSGVDCAATPAQCNWYFAANPEDYATTTVESDISKPAKYRWTFASSTPNLGIAAANASSTRAISFKTPTRYTRALIVVPIGAGNASVWTEWAGKKQR